MTIKLRYLFLLGATLLISGCDFKLPFGTAKPPTGQVVATIGDREITIRQLQAEMRGSRGATAAVQKAQQQATLQFLIQRSILADEAKKEGLDKDPNFILSSERAIDTLLVEQLQAKLAAGVPAPAVEEISHFEGLNPNIFAERKIFDVEQISMARPTDQGLLAKLKPFKSLDEVASFLTENHIDFRRGLSTIDAVGQSPKLIAAIVELPPQEVFIISSGNSILINQIRNTRMLPFVGPSADKYASNLLKAQHTQEAVQRQMASILAKAKGAIKINKDYQPTASPTAPAAAAPPK